MASHYKPHPDVTVSRKKLVEFMAKNVLPEATVDAFMAIFGFVRSNRVRLSELSADEISDMRGRGWYQRGKYLDRACCPRQAIPAQTTTKELQSQLKISEKSAIHALRAWGYHETKGVWHATYIK